MKRSRSPITLPLLLVILVVLLSALSASAAGNLVPSSLLGISQFAITANNLKPPECAAINLVRVVQFTATGSQNSLVLSTSASAALRGGSGSDCLVGGAGNDTLNGSGGQGYDICLGGGGVNTCENCELSYNCN